MPFFTYRDEAGLDDLLLPQPGWACVIFQDCQWCISIKNGCVVWFRRGTEWGCAQCGDYKTIWPMADGQHAAFEYGVTQKSRGGRVLVKFSTLIQKLPNADIYAFAEKEFAMTQGFARTDGG